MLRWLLMLSLSLSPLLAQAEVEVPPLQARVTDLTATLSAEQRAALESRLAGFEQQKGSQVAVLIVPTTQPEDIAQYSIRVVEQWKLGRKGVDDGVLVLLAKADRATRIEVGYGLEGALPDAIAKRIVEEVMIPRFREADFYGGIAAGVDRIIAVIEGEPLPAPKPAVNLSALENFFPLLFFIAIVVGGLLRSLLGEFMGGTVTGVVVGVVVWLLGAGLVFALIAGVVAFIITLAGGRGHGGSLGGGSFGGGGLGGGGFSGGGGGFGGFGGGGASGRW